MSQYRQHFFDANPTTRRHPRTLQQAFGPHTNNVIGEPVPALFWNPTRVLFAFAYIVAFVTLWMVL